MQMPELLMPAGDIQKAYIAFQYGADAIYCGSPMFSLRTRMNTFTEENIKEITEFAHSKGKQVYVTLNGFPHQNMIEVYKKHLAFLEEVKPDGLIIADTGVLEMANEYAPSVAKHLSVQSSTVNIPSMKFWMNSGVERVILAREISIEEVKKIHDALPDLELEYFVHGAVCMAYSGRCLLSNFMAGRDANRGACAHSCRWNYRIYDENGYEIDVSDRVKNEDGENVKQIAVDHEGTALDIHDFERKQYWEEELREGEIIPVEEDFHGTHIMSSRDMCMIENLEEVKDAGVVSLKVEGRNKTIYYLATVARAYRKALDNLAEGKPFDASLWNEIHATANRGFFAGFLKGKPLVDGQQYEANRSIATHHFVGQVLEWKDGKVRIEVKNRIDEGDEIQFLFPDMDDDFEVKADNLEKNEAKVDALHGGNGDGWFDCPTEVPVGILVRKKIGDETSPNFSRSK